MARYARIVDGAVFEIIELPEEWALTDVYVPDIAATIFPAGPEVSQGWLYSAGVYSEPPPPPTLLRSLPVDAFFERTTEEEAEEIEDAMMAKPTKIRRAYQAATVFKEGTDLWAALSATLSELFDEPRPTELLAPLTGAESSALAVPID